MNVRNSKLLGLLAASGAVAGLSALASAQPSVIHVSGATLLENLLNQRASTIDFIDADGDGTARGYPAQALAPFVDQLAPFDIPAASGAAATWSPDTKWLVAYGAIGSGNGFQELINIGRTFATGDSLPTSTAGTAGVNSNPQFTNDIVLQRRTIAYYNRYVYFKGGSAFDDVDPEFPPTVGLIVNQANPAGLPIRGVTAAGPSQFTALYTSPGGFNPLAERDNQPNTNIPAGVASTSPNDGLTAAGGLSVDIAPIDVPTTYFARISGTASPSAKPGQSGYGTNPRLAKNPDGTDNASRTNLLASLAPTGSPAVPPANLNRLSPDANTIFDTSIVFAPVAPVVNFGTGISQINMSDLRHLYSTGRRVSGENLVVVTRDSGSGTRNAWQNSIGIDPSWGVGDNLGAGNANSINDSLGSTFLPSNKGGNNRVELTVTNHRLAIGYVGPERGVPVAGDTSSGWLTRGEMGIPSVVNDTYGGTLPSRPTIQQIVTNNPNTVVQNINGVDHSGWVIGGPGVLATFGDPRSAPEAKGGFGWLEPQDGTGFFDINGNLVRDAVEPRPGVLNPAMRNVEAAAFINNITRSIQAFQSIPAAPQNFFTPGELAATRFILVQSQDRVQDPTDPVNLIPNPSFNLNLKNYILSDPNVVYGFNIFKTFDAGVSPNFSNSRAGKVPLRRTAANTYSDQALVPAGNAYITQSGALLPYPVIPTDPQSNTTNLPIRNLIAGDFNGDGVRDINDAVEMIAAFRSRNAGPAWIAPAASGNLLTIATAAGQTGAGQTDGGSACIEILGDFNGDGSFNLADLRFWADGLALQSGSLNRKAGFTALDNANLAAGGALNLFNTAFPAGNCKSYQAGDSRGDVTGSDLTRNTRGFGPSLANGVIDANDVAYVYAQFKQAGITGAANWNDIAEAARFDLSADINGDLQVDQADVDELVKGILGTCYGDLNLDGRTTLAERQTVITNVSTTPATWARGDLNGDGVINAADVSLACPADINCDALVSVQDIFDFLTAWFGNTCKADINGVGGVTVQDIFDFLSAWFAGPC